MHAHNRVYCEVHRLAELKASAQELDVKRTQSNLAKAQNPRLGEVLVTRPA
jgi:hypothetical protein